MEDPLLDHRTSLDQSLSPQYPSISCSRWRATRLYDRAKYSMTLHSQAEYAQYYRIFFPYFWYDTSSRTLTRDRSTGCLEALLI